MLKSEYRRGTRAFVIKVENHVVILWSIKVFEVQLEIKLRDAEHHI